MDQFTVDGARFIYETIRLIQTRLLPKHCAFLGGKKGEIELTLAQIHALFAIRDRSQVTVKDLAQALSVSAPSASAMVDRLVELGAASREQSREDRREVVVQLTEVGRHAVENTERVFLQSIGEVVEKIGPDYAEKWCEVYQRIRDVLVEEVSSRVTPKR